MDEITQAFSGLKFLLPVYTIAKALFIAVDIVLLVGFVYAFRKGWTYRPKFNVGKSPQKQMLTLRNAYFRKRWADLIKKYTEAPTVDSMRLAVLEADALVDKYLKDLQFPGEHFADRFAYMNKQDLKSVDGVWDAHRARNDIAHGKNISINEAKTAIKQYEAFFKEIEVFKTK
jgi:hypothetical protein